MFSGLHLKEKLWMKVGNRYWVRSIDSGVHEIRQSSNMCYGDCRHI